MVVAPVVGVELAVLPPFASALANPLVLPVWLTELLELSEGDDDATPEVVELPVF